MKLKFIWTMTLWLPAYAGGCLLDAAHAQESQQLITAQLLFLDGRREAAQPSDKTDAAAGDALAEKRKRDANSRNAAPGAAVRKPQPGAQQKPSVTAMRKLAPTPLPPRRPQGELTENAEPFAAGGPPASSEATGGMARTDLGGAQGAAPKAEIQVDVAGDGESVRLAQARSFQPIILLLVRPGVARPKDLDGGKVVVWRTDVNSEDLRAMLTAGAGVVMTLVRGDFETALYRLADGEVDAVVIGVGPKLSEGDAGGLSVKPFHFLEVPL